MLKRLSAPIRTFFNARFVALSNSVQEVQRQVVAVREGQQHADARQEALATSVSADIRGSLDAQHADLLSVAALLGRSVDQAVDGVGLLLERLDPEGSAGPDHLVSQVAGRIRASVIHAFDPTVSGSVSQLDRMHADIANYTNSHRGWASQAGLWFNPPISITHAPGGVQVADINERVAEIPFVFAALGSLPRGSRVLDVGSTESTVAVSLASLGYEVTAVDPRPYPLQHENLTVHVGPVESFHDPEPYDAAVLLSSIEHFGLGAYDLPENPQADAEALATVASLLRPGGMLVLTTPYGDAPTTELQRTYSPAQIDALLEGWEVLERSYLTQVSATEWRRTDSLDDLSGSHVVLVRAVKPGA